MLTEAIKEFAVWLLGLTGYFGAAVLMALESMIAPVPSEAVMPFVGFLVAKGTWGLVPAVLATSAGSLAGSYLSYLMGYYGGRPLVLKVGKYLLLDVHDLELAERFFGGKKSAWLIFVSRFVPVVRHLISIPAGMGRMRFLPFAVPTLIGATMWNSFLLWCGYLLEERWDEYVKPYPHHADAVIVGLLAGMVGWFVFWKLKRRRALRRAAEQAE